MVMFLMTYHFFEDNVIMMINRYFYQEFYAEPDINDPDREAKVLHMHETSMKFISKYIDCGDQTGNVEAAEMDALILECFPELIPYLQGKRASRNGKLESSRNSIDYDALSQHLEMLTTTDWVALFRICELEESRRGRAIRYVLSLLIFNITNIYQ